MAGIVVIDYHKGNLSSVARGVVSAGGTARVSDEPQRIRQASGLVLPGVGSFEAAMRYMTASGQAEAILEALAKGVPFLGICLGLQVLFTKGSELAVPHADVSCEDGRKAFPTPADSSDMSCESAHEARWVDGLGVFSGTADKLHAGRLKVPHVGWDQLDFTHHAQRCPLLVGVANGSTMYFTHSYAVSDAAADIVVARTHYTTSFASVLWSDNIFGCQFHPEKSSGAGLRVLSNFVRIVEHAGVST